MKWAWIENDKIRDICMGGEPSQCYHPDVAIFYNTQVPDEAINGDWFINGSLITAAEYAARQSPETPIDTVSVELT